MKSEDWKLVKRHDVLIYPTEEHGVLKAIVTEIDVKVEERRPTLHWGYPYGKTAETGALKVKYEVNGVEQEHVENLASLIKFNQAIFAELIQAYQQWQNYLVAATTYKEAYTSLIQEKTSE